MPAIPNTPTARSHDVRDYPTAVLVHTDGSWTAYRDGRPVTGQIPADAAEILGRAVKHLTPLAPGMIGKAAS